MKKFVFATIFIFLCLFSIASIADENQIVENCKDVLTAISDSEILPESKEPQNEGAVTPWEGTSDTVKGEASSILPPIVLQQFAASSSAPQVVSAETVRSDISYSQGNPRLTETHAFKNAHDQEILDAYWNMPMVGEKGIWPDGAAENVVSQKDGSRSVTGFRPLKNIPVSMNLIQRPVVFEDGSKGIAADLLDSGLLQGTIYVRVVNGQLTEDWSRVSTVPGRSLEGVPFLGWGVRAARNLASQTMAWMHSQDAQKGIRNMEDYINQRRKFEFESALSKSHHEFDQAKLAKINELSVSPDTLLARGFDLKALPQDMSTRIFSGEYKVVQISETRAVVFDRNGNPIAVIEKKKKEKIAGGGGSGRGGGNPKPGPGGTGGSVSSQSSSSGKQATSAKEGKADALKRLEQQYAQIAKQAYNPDQTGKSKGSKESMDSKSSVSQEKTSSQKSGVTEKKTSSGRGSSDEKSAEGQGKKNRDEAGSQESVLRQEYLGILKNYHSSEGLRLALEDFISQINRGNKDSIALLYRDRAGNFLSDIKKDYTRITDDGGDTMDVGSYSDLGDLQRQINLSLKSQDFEKAFGLAKKMHRVLAELESLDSLSPSEVSLRAALEDIIKLLKYSRPPKDVATAKTFLNELDLFSQKKLIDQYTPNLLAPDTAISQSFLRDFKNGRFWKMRLMSLLNFKVLSRGKWKKQEGVPQKLVQRGGADSVQSQVIANTTDDIGNIEKFHLDGGLGNLMQSQLADHAQSMDDHLSKGQPEVLTPEVDPSQKSPPRKNETYWNQKIFIVDDSTSANYRLETFAKEFNQPVKGKNLNLRIKNFMDAIEGTIMAQGWEEVEISTKYPLADRPPLTGNHYTHVDFTGRISEKNVLHMGSRSETYQFMSSRIFPVVDKGTLGSTDITGAILYAIDMAVKIREEGLLRNEIVQDPEVILITDGQEDDGNRLIDASRIKARLDSVKGPPIKFRSFIVGRADEAAEFKSLGPTFRWSLQDVSNFYDKSVEMPALPDNGVNSSGDSVAPNDLTVRRVIEGFNRAINLYRPK